MAEAQAKPPAVQHSLIDAFNQMFSEGKVDVIQPVVLAMLRHLAQMSAKGGRLERIWSGIEAVKEAFRIEEMERDITPAPVKSQEDAKNFFFKTFHMFEHRIEQLPEGASPERAAMQWAAYCIKSGLDDDFHIPDDDPFIAYPLSAIEAQDLANSHLCNHGRMALNDFEISGRTQVENYRRKNHPFVQPKNDYWSQLQIHLAHLKDPAAKKMAEHAMSALFDAYQHQDECSGKQRGQQLAEMYGAVAIAFERKDPEALARFYSCIHPTLLPAADAIINAKMMN